MSNLKLLADVAERQTRVIEVNDPNTYAIKSVKEVIYRANGTPFLFFVEWDGYDAKHNSWVSADDIYSSAEEFCVFHGFSPRKKPSINGPIVVRRK